MEMIYQYKNSTSEIYKKNVKLLTPLAIWSITCLTPSLQRTPLPSHSPLVPTTSPKGNTITMLRKLEIVKREQLQKNKINIIEGESKNAKFT